ncbi:hypothetical protein QR680_015987 [Steinernema hermaphroditum]|uniref:Uncharacterized protein n=1 Tax=Steinernema hermaphroditum TaxID=289476 RepID=A0AA39H9N0_9BILA|nr:hypothetical protein QR680_015987 [Steinernema hermaphroditum]
MIINNAYCEYIFVILPMTMTTVYLTRIFLKRPLWILWKESPPLAVLFASIISQLTIDATMVIQWILLLSDLISNGPESTVLLEIPILLRVGIQLFFAITNSAIFIQRIYILLFPLKSLRKTNRVIVLLELTVSVIAASFAIAPNVPRAWNFVPVPVGCFSANCSNLLPGRSYSATTTLVMSICTVLLGGAFQYIFYKYRKLTKSSKPDTAMLHRFARYALYIRLVFESVPYFTDLFLSNIFGIKISNYLGPYGVVATSLDYCASTFVYYNLVIKKKQTTVQVVSVNARTTQSN